MSPIIIQEEPFNDLHEKTIRLWLNRKECHDFQAYLATMSATLAAEAGNELVAGEEENKRDAQLKAEEARLYDKLASVLAEMRNPEKHFVTVKLTPKPIDHHD